MQYKKLSTSIATAALVTTVLFAAPYVANAQSTNSPSHTGFFQGLMQFIEQKFGLDQTQVQSAVNEYKAQRQATITPRPTLSQQQMADNEKNRLDKLVQSGKITSDQEQAIITELAALRSKYPVEASASAEQRKTQRQSIMNDLKSWAQSQNINLQYVMPAMGGSRMGKRGMMGGKGRGNWNNQSPSPSPTVTP